MQNQKNNSSLPLAIIGIVLIIFVGGGVWWYYSSSKSSANKSNTTKTTTTPDDAAAKKLYQSAPAGAQPENTLGSPTAAVTVEEFADYQCPTCGLMFPKMKEINNLYGSRIKFTFRNFPLQMHKYGFDAAVAAEAAGLQDRNKFWQMQDQLFTNRKDWENATDVHKIFEDYAQKIGLDVAQFQSDVMGMAAQTRVKADQERGRALNIQGTPTIYINGKSLAFEQMEVSQMRQVIDAELQKASNPQQPNQSNNQAVDNANQAANNSSNSK